MMMIIAILVRIAPFLPMLIMLVLLLCGESGIPTPTRFHYVETAYGFPVEGCMRLISLVWIYIFGREVESLLISVS